MLGLLAVLLYTRYLVCKRRARTGIFPWSMMSIHLIAPLVEEYRVSTSKRLITTPACIAPFPCVRELGGLRLAALGQPQRLRHTYCCTKFREDQAHPSTARKRLPYTTAKMSALKN